MKTLVRLALLALFICPAAARTTAAQSPQSAPTKALFQISVPAKSHSSPITGRVYLILSRKESKDLLDQIGNFTDETPFFAADISALPAGDYYAQAIVNIYTEFHRSDGHTIWAHMDQWEGQQFNHSPGNLYSDVKKIHFDPTAARPISLEADHVIPPVEIPADTRWVKHIKIESKLLTKFWGHPIYIGAVVLLPQGYEEHPSVSYPVVYEQGHFGLQAPLYMLLEPPTTKEESRGGVERYAAFQAWSGPNFPRMIGVTFQHPTPYFDDSYAVNSANDGPYGDALMKELIPYLEEHFRMIREPWARLLTGGSTGGWESLALQLYHPDFFGGTFTGFPDPIDFRHYQLVNAYKDDNAFDVPGYDWVQRDRPMMRTAEGQVIETMQQMSLLEEVLGTHGRSGQQFEAWEAVYGPVGPEGYTQPLWDKLTGKIDHHVADYMRDHGYDLRDYAEKNWSTIGPQLTNKINIWVGDMDNFYLNLAVYNMEEFFNSHPEAHAHFQYGRPEKGHGWLPWPLPDFIRTLAQHLSDSAPSPSASSPWHY